MQVRAQFLKAKGRLLINQEDATKNMNNRRKFLKEVASVAAFSPFFRKSAGASLLGLPVATASALSDEWHTLQFKPHWIRQGDGHGGWTLLPAQIRYVEYGDGKVPYYNIKGDGTMIFGVAQMDNGEVIAIGTWDSGEIVKNPILSSAKPIVAFSRDGGNSWSDFKLIENGNGRPMMLTYLGRGNLTFQTDLVRPIMQYFSHDYGRTWPERQQLQLSSFGTTFETEGAALVDRNAHGVATRIAETAGYTKGEKRLGRRLRRWG